MAAKAFLIAFSSFLIVTSSGAQQESSADSCPIWHQMENGRCECVSWSNIITCRNDAIYLKDGYCMTMDPLCKEEVVGPCIYTCRHWSEINKTYLLMTRIEATSLLELNNETCGPFHRQGVLCSRCEDGYGLPVYSYETSCVPCRDSWYNWVLYVAVVYLPLTMFVFIIILFRLNVNSGLLVVYVILSQIMANRNVVQLYLLVRNETIFKLVASVYAIWNLEFFRPFTSDLCISPKITVLQGLALDYVVALYPMALILICSLVVYWHDRNEVVVYLCRPLYLCFHRFRKEWNMGSSLIEAFATLILLSFVKVMTISLDILSFTTYYYMNKSKLIRVVHADPSIEYLSGDHVPYFILAVVMVLVFNILPILLLSMYPCSCFRKVLSSSKLNTRILQTFMDAFTGSYKLQPHCLQSFTALYLWANVISISLYSSLELLLYHSGIAYLLIIMLLILALVRPYKNKWHNMTGLLLIFAAFQATNSINIYLESMWLKKIDHNEWVEFNYTILKIAFFVLPLYGLCLLFSHLIPVKMKNYLRTYMKNNRWLWAIWQWKTTWISSQYRGHEELEDEDIELKEIE